MHIRLGGNLPMRAGASSQQPNLSQRKGRPATSTKKGRPKKPKKGEVLCACCAASSAVSLACCVARHPSCDCAVGIRAGLTTLCTALMGPIASRLCLRPLQKKKKAPVQKSAEEVEVTPPMGPWIINTLRRELLEGDVTAQQLRSALDPDATGRVRLCGAEETLHALHGCDLNIDAARCEYLFRVASSSTDEKGGGRACVQTDTLLRILYPDGADDPETESAVRGLSFKDAVPFSSPPGGDLWASAPWYPSQAFNATARLLRDAWREGGGAKQSGPTSLGGTSDRHRSLLSTVLRV